MHLGKVCLLIATAASVTYGQGSPNDRDCFEKSDSAYGVDQGDLVDHTEQLIQGIKSGAISTRSGVAGVQYCFDGEFALQGLKFGIRRSDTGKMWWLDEIGQFNKQLLCHVYETEQTEVITGFELSTAREGVSKIAFYTSFSQSRWAGKDGENTITFVFDPDEPLIGFYGTEDGNIKSLGMIKTTPNRGKCSLATTDGDEPTVNDDRFDSVPQTSKQLQEKKLSSENIIIISIACLMVVSFVVFWTHRCYCKKRTRHTVQDVPDNQQQVQEKVKPQEKTEIVDTERNLVSEHPPIKLPSFTSIELSKTEFEQVTQGTDDNFTHRGSVQPLDIKGKKLNSEWTPPGGLTSFVASPSRGFSQANSSMRSTQKLITRDSQKKLQRKQSMPNNQCSPFQS